MSQRLEDTLVDALETAYSTGAAPAVEHASPHQWANACHYLFEGGRIRTLEHAARHLHAAFPELTYLTTLVELFDGVPRHLPAPLAFLDNPAADIQVVRRSNCDSVLLCFCAREGTLGLPLNFIHLWLGRLPVSLVYLKDFQNLGGARGYPSLGPDRASSIVALHRLAQDIGAERIYALGVSLGGYAALSYSLELGAEAVLSLAGATDLTQDFNEQLGMVTPRYLSLIQEAPEYASNLRERFMATERPPRVLLAFSAGHSRDRRQAERMAGLPNVELIPTSDYSLHNVLYPLIRDGQFLPLLFRLLSGTTVHETVHAQP